MDFFQRTILSPESHTPQQAHRTRSGPLATIIPFRKDTTNAAPTNTHLRSKTYNCLLALLCCGLLAGFFTTHTHAHNNPTKSNTSPNTKSTKKTTPKRPWWKGDYAIGGVVGSWGGDPLLGIRGVFPFSSHIAIRLSWSLLFSPIETRHISFSTFSFDLLIRLPSPVSSVRNYAVTRVDFWPLWNILNTNPGVLNFSEQPVFGLSMLVGLEFFFIQGLSYFLETGFSTGMAIGLGKIKRQEAFGFVIQSGLQLYF